MHSIIERNFAYTMKVIILCALVAGCLADGAVLVNHAIAYSPAIVETGGSTQYRSQDGIGNYAFGYNEDHTSGGTFRKESGDAYGNKAGSYGLRDADGRVRVVNYVADALGYRADISSNEPGVAPKDPAATTINKGAVVAATTHHLGYAAPYPVAYANAHHYGAHLPYAYTAAHPVAYGVLGSAYHAPVAHYAYTAPGHATLLGGHHYAVNTHHLGAYYPW